MTWYHDACVGDVPGAADDALAYFERLKTGLTPDGLIMIKENVCASGFVVDKVPSLPRAVPSRTMRQWGLFYTPGARGLSRGRLLSHSVACSCLPVRVKHVSTPGATVKAHTQQRRPSVEAHSPPARPRLAGVPHGATCLRAGGQEDSSLTRSNQYLLELFERAGLVVKYNILQRSFPKELFKARP